MKIIIFFKKLNSCGKHINLVIMFFKKLVGIFKWRKFPLVIRVKESDILCINILKSSVSCIAYAAVRYLLIHNIIRIHFLILEANCLAVVRRAVVNHNKLNFVKAYRLINKWQNRLFDIILYIVNRHNYRKQKLILIFSHTISPNKRIVLCTKALKYIIIISQKKGIFNHIIISIY